MCGSEANQIAAELQRYLPEDLPQRERVVELAGAHLALLSSANRALNLTAITTPRESAIKHVLDSVLPASLLGEARLVLDLGSGGGFPGIPLGIACPEKQLILTESVGKKAAFLKEVVDRLGLRNVEIYAGRAEAWLADNTADTVVVRAVGSTRKLLGLLGPVRSHLGELLLYKGPGGERELSVAQALSERLGLHGEVALRYTLPADLGRRSVLRFVPVGVK